MLQLKGNTLIKISMIFSITLIGVIGQIRNTDTQINIQLGKNSSVSINAKRSLSPEAQTNDCLPWGESSHSLNCDD